MSTLAEMFGIEKKELTHKHKEQAEKSKKFVDEVFDEFDKIIKESRKAKNNTKTLRDYLNETSNEEFACAVIIMSAIVECMVALYTNEPLEGPEKQKAIKNKMVELLEKEIKK